MVAPILSGTAPILLGSAGTLPNAANLPWYHTVIANVRSGTQDRKLLIVGDSISDGIFDLTGQGYSTYLADFLSQYANTQLGLSAPQNSGATDARWALGSGWSKPASAAGWGNVGAIIQGTTAAATCTYKPTSGTYDTFDCYYATQAVTSGFSINFNGGTNNVVNSDTGAVGVAKVTVSGAATVTPNCNLSIVTGATCTILGVEPYLSTSRAIRLGNAGISGASVNSWANATTVPNAAQCLGAYVPDSVIIMLGGNDMGTGQSVGQFISNYQLLVSTIKGINANCDIIACSENPWSPGFATGFNPGTYWNALQQLALANGWGYIDIFNNLNGSAGYTTLHNAGWYADGIVHPSSALGQPDLGRMLGVSLLNQL